MEILIIRNASFATFKQEFTQRFFVTDWVGSFQFEVVTNDLNVVVSLVITLQDLNKLLL